MKAAVCFLLLAAPTLGEGLQLRPAVRGFERRPTAQPIVLAAANSEALQTSTTDGAKVKTWTERINRVSTFASILCVMPAAFTRSASFPPRVVATRHQLKRFESCVRGRRWTALSSRSC